MNRFVPVDIHSLSGATANVKFMDNETHYTYIARIPMPFVQLFGEEADYAESRNYWAMVLGLAAEGLFEEFGHLCEC